MSSDLPRQLYVDGNFNSYKGWMEPEWAIAVADRADSAPVLREFVLDLLLSWRTTGYNASLPVVLVQGLKDFADGYTRDRSNDSGIIAFASGVLERLSRELPEIVADRELQSKLKARLLDLATEFERARALVNVEFQVAPLWESYLKTEPFTMTVWASQRISYVAFYNAYEAFLTHCVRLALGQPNLRSMDKAFNKALQTRFTKDLSETCWLRPEIHVGRLVRHALSHNGGRETDKLKEQGHSIRMIDGDDVLHIAPADIHSLLRSLKGGVLEMVDVCVELPQFSS